MQYEWSGKIYNIMQMHQEGELISNLNADYDEQTFAKVRQKFFT